MRGGPRPGGGRPKGSKDKKPRKRKEGAAPKPAAKKQRHVKAETSPQSEGQSKPEGKKVAPGHDSDLKERVKQLLQAGTNAKAKAFRDLASKLQRNQTLTSAEIKTMVMLERELAETVKDESESPDPSGHSIESDEVAEELDPLTYMLKIMNDPKAEKKRRDLMAIEAAKYLHIRMDTPAGKKDEKADRAKSAASGKFAPGAAPLKRVK